MTAFDGDRIALVLAQGVDGESAPQTGEEAVATGYFLTGDLRGVNPEYALLVALVAAVCIVSITFLGGKANDKVTQVGSQLS